MKKYLVSLMVMTSSLCFGQYSSGPVVGIKGSSGTVVEVNTDGQMHVVLAGKNDRSNSTTSTLDAAEVWAGTATDITDYNSIMVFLTADQSSATKGFVVQYSHDTAEWFDGESYTYTASTEKFYSPPPWMKYYRLKFTNGGVSQTVFRVDTFLRKTAVKPSSHNLMDDIADEDDATISIVIPKLRTAQDTYISAAATTSGNHKTSLEELESGVSVNSNTQLKTSLFDTNGIPAEVDNSTHSLQTIAYEHHEIHSGSHYHIDGYVDIAINGVYDMQWTTPDSNKWAHFTWELACENETLFEVWEGATITNAGTAITAFNNNRNSANTSIMTIAAQSNTSLANANANADTSTNGATLLASGIIGSGRSGGDAKRSAEMILKQNTVYCFRAVANAAGYINFNVEWYEHTDKD